MKASPLRSGLVFLCVTALTLGAVPAPAFAEADPVMGSIAGKVIDERSGRPVPNVVVRAHAITRNERLPDVMTDERGTFYLQQAPAAVYSFTLTENGVEYALAERINARAMTSFLLEGCFELDRESRTATIGDCRSGLIPEARVATIGPHRFLRPEPAATARADSILQGPRIGHEIACWPYDEFIQTAANIQSDVRIVSARVYFHADQSPNFYYVDLTPPSYASALPRPLRETRQVTYYVEAVNENRDTGRSPTRTVDVTSRQECRQRNPGTAYIAGNPNMAVGATQAGLPPIPAGFQPLGIGSFVNAAGVVTPMAAGAGGGGGIGTTGWVLIIAAAAGGATGIYLALDDDEASLITTP